MLAARRQRRWDRHESQAFRLALAIVPSQRSVGEVRPAGPERGLGADTLIPRSATAFGGLALMRWWFRWGIVLHPDKAAKWLRCKPGTGFP